MQRGCKRRPERMHVREVQKCPRPRCSSGPARRDPISQYLCAVLLSYTRSPVCPVGCWRRVELQTDLDPHPAASQRPQGETVDTLDDSHRTCCCRSAVGFRVKLNSTFKKWELRTANRRWCVRFR